MKPDLVTLHAALHLMLSGRLIAWAPDGEDDYSPWDLNTTSLSSEEVRDLAKKAGWSPCKRVPLW